LFGNKAADGSITGGQFLPEKEKAGVSLLRHYIKNFSKN
jgi:hypothetical protein